jgi:hypothetical protein
MIKPVLLQHELGMPVERRTACCGDALIVGGPLYRATRNTVTDFSSNQKLARVRGRHDSVIAVETSLGCTQRGLNETTKSATPQVRPRTRPRRGIASLTGWHPHGAGALENRGRPR